MNCLYERKRPIFIDANELKKSGLTSGTSDKHTRKCNDVQFRLFNTKVGDFRKRKCRCLKYVGEDEK